MRDDSDDGLPAMAREALTEIADQIERLEKIADLDRKIVAAVRQDEVARRLTAIFGVGPIIAATARAACPIRAAFGAGGLRGLDRFDAKVQFEARQGKARLDLETRKPSAPIAIGRRCDGDPEAFSTWCRYAAMGERSSPAAPVQGCRDGDGEQDGSGHLGANCLARRHD